MRTTFFTFCFMLSIALSYAQPGYQPAYPYEIGLQVGSSQFLGDLGGSKGYGRPFIIDTDFKSIRPTLGVYGRWNISPYFSARVDLNYLQVRGDDALAGRGYQADNPPLTGRTVYSDGVGNISYNPCTGCDAGRPEVEAGWFRRYRNLNFRSRIFEASLSGEIIPYNFELGGGYQAYSVLSPYISVGIGIFNFKPQTRYKDQWIDLKPLSTEGQGLVDGRVPYNLTQMMVPFGLGVKWNYNDLWSVSLEVNHRLTFTDYIDDVSLSYVDPAVFYENFDPSKAELAEALARRSQEWDSGNVFGNITSPGEQRGDPKDNDSYYTISVRFSYFLDPQSIGGGRRYGCPVW